MQDLAYRAGDGLSAYEEERCRLDVYLPPAPARTADAPVLVFLHGGAIQGGDKDSARVLASLVNPHGVVAVGVNYRLSPRVKYPEYVRDCAAAIGWVKAHASDYGASPERIFVTGHSAGGYLAMMAALGPGFLEEAGLGVADIAGLIPISGQMVTHSTVREERGLARSIMLVDDASPLRHVRRIETPVLLICGDGDMPARLEENLLMRAWLQAAGSPNVSALSVPGRTHESVYNRCADPGDPAGKAIIDFILKQTAARAPGGG
ncbi:MAG: Lipase 2 [Lentisphaerae bacterium ADurb.BinA184]|nr:MAG: Lipase 2 [Lentisphaerae bacterium ADurb.BinA184]